MTSDVMNVVEKQVGNVAVFRLHGKLNSTSAPVLEKCIIERLEQGNTKILLDLAEVIYINSAGLRMLLSVKKQIKSSRGALVVCAVRSEVHEMMKICGFDHVLDIVATEEEALRRF